MRLAASNLPADETTALYTVPADRRAVLTVSLCNRAAGRVAVRLALTNGAEPTDADWIEYGQGLAAAAVLERTGIALAGGQSVYAHASGAGVSAVAFGVEEQL